MEHNSYYKKGGETQPKPKPKMGKKAKPKEPQIIRGWVDDEPYEYGDGGAIYKGNNVKIKETGKTMKVTDISKGKKGYVQFTGSEGTFLKGDIDKMAKGGEIDKTGSSKLFDLEYGDVFLVTRKNHTASGYYVYLDLYEEYNKVYLECLPFPSLRPEFGGKHVLIDDVQDGDIKIISKEKAGKMLLDYMIDREKIKPFKKRQGKKAYSKMAKGGSTKNCWCYDIGGI